MAQARITMDRVPIEDLAARSDETGQPIEILRLDILPIMRFGLIHIATIYPGVATAWQYRQL